ncbi:MAG: hypothetical protein AAF638_01790 [Pseudomonadota bacterium]
MRKFKWIAPQAAFMALAVLATPALAECADDLAVVENALVTSTLSDGDRAAIQSMVDAAREQSAAGAEDACTATLTQAKALLGIE